jgi:hypothetical protein
MIFLHIIGSTFAAAPLYIATSMIFIGITGSDAEKGVNGLQVVTVLFNFPIFLAISTAVTILIMKLLKPRRPVLASYGLVGLIAILAGLFLY